LAVVSVVLRTAALLTAIFAGIAVAQEPDSFTVEPPMLVPDRGEESSDANPQDVDLAKLEKDFARAKRNSADAQHLYRIGVISQVDVEQRALRVIRLEADLAKRRLEVAQQQATSVGSVLVNGQPQTDEATKAELARLSEAAQAAAAKRDRAEIEAAETNLRRQQRLFAVGTGRKSDVAKAEQKLAEVKAQFR
jgi:multidrug resistance efflux pump